MFPTYYLDKMTENNLSQYENLLVQIVKKAADKNIKKAVIVGAGEAGKKIYHYLTMYGIRAEAFTDNNPKLQGKQVYGIPVKTLKDDFQNNNYIVASFAFAEELKVEILKEKGDNVQIFSCLD
jgi:NADH/NAD ratio-sensing transcriptional regulator Rex